MKRIVIVVASLFYILFCIPNSAFTDVYVDASRSDDTGDGSSWPTAKKYLQSALALPSPGNIYVAQGTYYPDEGTGQTDNSPTSTFQMRFGVNIYGGYPTGGGSRNISAYVTTLSGDLDQSGSKNASDAYHVVTGENSATIDGFTITGGNANGPSTLEKDGGGMFINSKSPMVSNCTFSQNAATLYGGGLFNGYSSNGTITTCTFSSNTSGGGGGGLNSHNSSPTITRCTFSENQVTGGPGGGIRCYDTGDNTLTNCVFSGNSASSTGGGIYSGSTNLTVTNCTLYDNTATSGYGISEASSTSSIKNSILWGSNNQVAGSPTITYSDVQQSSGTYAGTGNINSDPLFVSGSDLHLTDYSPCIGTGTATDAPSDDIEGNSRGTPPDMGAYENSRSDPAIRLQAKVFLEGPYVAADDSMTTTLCPDNDDVIPTTSPYNDGRTVDPIPSDVTDWIFVKLRSTAEGAAVDSCSFFLKSNGNIVDDDGTTSYVPMDAPAGDYFIVVEHRNHLTVMSASAQSLTSGSSTLYDFSTGLGQYYGTDAALLETGVYGMYAGDTNGSGIVTNSDKTSIISDLNSSGYYDADANCSGVVTNSDKSPIISNLNKASDIR